MASKQTPARLSATFYRSASGNEPVREWLRALDPEHRQSIGEDIAYQAAEILPCIGLPLAHSCVT